ncbi:hypothetical protein BH09MYX1_BH09MYX1_18040 [soil metagenome]
MKHMRSIRFAVAAGLSLALASSLTGCSRFRSDGTGDGGTRSGGFFATIASLVGFEGQIDMAIGMPGLAAAPMTMTLKLKGKRMRADYTGLGAAGMSIGMIYDADAKKTYTFMSMTHEYTETDLTKLPAAAPTPTTPKPVATKTGTSDRIAGYDCENWVVVTPGIPNKTELCVAHGMTFYAMGFGPFASFGSGGDTWGAALDGGGFPLRMRMLDASGKETMRMEATRIEKKSKPDSEFQIPPGYKKSGGGFGVGGAGGSGGAMPPP